MKKFLPGCVVLAMAATGSAGIIFSDGFNYGIGPADIVGAPGSYWAETAPASVPTMIYTNDQLRISFQANQDINAPLQDAPYASGGPVAALYSSFTIRFVALPTAVGTYIAHFRDVSGLGFRGRVFVSTTNAAAGHYRIGIANAASTTRAAWQIPADLSLNTAYFIVFRFNIGTGETYLWLHPALETSPGVAATDFATHTDVAGFSFRQNAGIGAVAVDDVKVGTSFSDVVPPALMITVVAGDLLLSWPSSASDYVFRFTDSLPAQWSDFNDQGTVQGDFKVVTLSGVLGGAGNRFLELRKP